MKTSIYKIIFVLLLLSSIGCMEKVEMTKEQKWIEDINFYQDTLTKKHLNLFHTISKKVFNDEVEKLKNNISELSESQIVVELMRITRMVGDGHTGFAIMSKSHGHFPMRFKLFDGVVRVVKTIKDHQEYLNNKLVAIDGRPIHEILDKLTPIAQNVENEYSLNESLAFALTQDELLNGVEITDELGKAKFSFENETGEIHDLDFQSVNMSDFINNTIYDASVDNHFSDRSVTHSNGLFLSFDKKSKTALLNFSEYGSLEEMSEFAAKTNDFLSESGAKSLIIDLRNNQGGSFFIGLYLISELLQVESLNWESGIYTLIGNLTFSAGMSNAIHFKQLMNAKIIGEPTGSNPNGYQEVGYSQLPNSEYTITYSKRFYRFQDVATKGLQPDVEIKTSWEDYKSGNDKVLQWVMKDITY